ncbi:MAG: hypothetical protein QXD59_01705 [Candidatus Caldarchaeum sp.]
MMGRMGVWEGVYDGRVFVSWWGFLGGKGEVGLFKGREGWG